MIDFLKEVFNAQAVMRLAAPKGSGAVEDPCGKLWRIARELNGRDEAAMQKAAR